MIRLGLFLFFITGTQLPAQDTLWQDFNDDQVPDSLVWTSAGGSGFGGRIITFTDGDSDAQWDINGCSSFGSFVKLVPIPEAWFGDRYAGLRRRVGQILSRGEAGQANNSSLEWLLNGRRVSENRWENATEWQTGLPEKPATSYVQLYQVDLPAWLSGGMEAGKESDRYWLLYYGHNHFGHRFTDWVVHSIANERLEVWQSKHGLVLVDQTNNRHRWLFISQAGLTGSPSKLRWVSIGAVACTGGLIEFQQQMPVMGERYGWTINLETSTLTRRVLTD